MRPIRPYLRAIKGEFSRNIIGDVAPIDVIFCVADHFEPRVGRVSMRVERERVSRWVRRYPLLAERHRDFDGRPPRHTWFFPLDEYFSEHLERLAELCAEGYGEIELHLHHDRDNPVDLMRKLNLAKKLYMFQGGMARTKWSEPVPENARYAFIHGNWALDNSWNGRWCGVNCELKVLRQTGCYADFTYPSAPHPTQPKTVNAIYWAEDDPEEPRSHEEGDPVKVGGHRKGDLMIITGPLRLNWHSRRWGLLPRIENSDISWHNSPSPQRADLWVKTGIQVKGRPEWIFVKVHTHGAADRNAKVLLDPHGPMDEMLSYMEERYNDGKKFRLHYVTAREMYNIIRAAEAGLSGNPGKYRDFELISNLDLIERIWP